MSDLAKARIEKAIKEFKAQFLDPKKAWIDLNAEVEQ